MFNNREIATAIWLLLIATYVLRYQTVRDAVKSLFSVHPKILVLLALMLAYAIAEIALLAFFHAWHIGLLKDAILWFCFTGFALLMNTVTSSHKENTFAAVLRDNGKVMLFITFFAQHLRIAIIGGIDTCPRHHLRCSTRCLRQWEKRRSSGCKSYEWHSCHRWLWSACVGRVKCYCRFAQSCASRNAPEARPAATALASTYPFPIRRRAPQCLPDPFYQAAHRPREESRRDPLCKTAYAPRIRPSPGQASGIQYSKRLGPDAHRNAPRC